MQYKSSFLYNFFFNYVRNVWKHLETRDNGLLGAGVTGACKLLSMGTGTLSQSVSCGHRCVLSVELPVRLSGWITRHQNLAVAFLVLLRIWMDWELVFEKSRRWWRTRNERKNKTQNKKGKNDTLKDNCSQCSGKGSLAVQGSACAVKKMRTQQTSPFVSSKVTADPGRRRRVKQELAVTEGKHYHVLLFIIIAIVIITKIAATTCLYW